LAGSPGGPCAAHHCLKPRYRDGWCIAHWFAHRARTQLIEAEPGQLLETVTEPFIETETGSDSLAICEAIWNAS
jgi:hypothetical protein